MRIQNGQYLINTNGTSSSAIASGSIAGFAWSNPYIVALSFDPESLRTRLTISYYTELKVDTGWIDTGLSSADITAAGFHYEGLGTSGHTFVDNFLVTGYPPIPEASSIALLMAVSLFPLLILRRLLRKHRG